eukprot:6200160-Pleurochrysis_carterae.AAC.8
MHLLACCGVCAAQVGSTKALPDQAQVGQAKIWLVVAPGSRSSVNPSCGIRSLRLHFLHLVASYGLQEA